MREDEPMTQTLKASEARQQFSQLLNQVFRKETRVIVERSGIPVAAIVSADDLRRLKQYDQERAQRFEVLDQMREAFKDVPADEIEREVARAVEDVRAERRVQQHPRG